MPIAPLPQFEADLAEHEAAERDRIAYEQLNAPKTIVIRYGVMGMIAELPYNGEAKPGCGSKLVASTTRGTELGEMLTSTCPNAGCSKSVTRKQMLDYIDRSGGRHYPFADKGRILRVATKEDLDAQAALDADRTRLRQEVARLAESLGHSFKIVEVERIIGGEVLTVYIASEQRVETRALSNDLELQYKTRVVIRGVGARDEARLTADYERCGQHCCCKNFLKVLKPVSMRSAKQQKATLEPLKISGRCGRLMCCLRYEDSTYQDLKKNLPNRKSRVGTPEGDGTVIDSQILTQLVLIELDGPQRTRVAIPVEELTEPGQATRPPDPEPTPMRSARPDRGGRSGRGAGPDRAGGPDRESRRGEPTPGGRQSVEPSDRQPTEQSTERAEGEAAPAEPRKRRRRRRRKSGADQPQAGGTPQSGQPPRDNAPDASNQSRGGEQQADESRSPEGGPRKKRRRRRRRRGGGEASGEGGGDAGGGPGGGDSGGPSGPDSAS